mgnify:CR=1 FL=1
MEDPPMTAKACITETFVPDELSVILHSLITNKITYLYTTYASRQPFIPKSLIWAHETSHNLCLASNI